MDEKNTTTAAQPEQTTTPAGAAQTQSTAGSVDINAIVSQAAQKAAEIASEAQEKKMDAVFKSMLKQSGLDDAAIQTMLAEYKAKQITPEQTIAQLTKERDDGFAARDAELTALKQEKILRSHGLTDDEDIEIYGIRIGKLVTDGKTFEQAAAEYFEAHPRKQKASANATNSGTGRTSMTPDGFEDYKKMSPQDKIKFKAENPSLYETFKKRLGF